MTMQSSCRRLLEDGQPRDVCGLHGGSAALFVARLQDELGKTVCCVVHSDEFLEPLAQDVSLFTDIPVVPYPALEIAPYTPLDPDPVTVATRLSTLYFLQENNKPCIVLTSAEALLRRILPRQVLADRCELVMAGEETDRDALVSSLTGSGYQLCDLVQQPGDMAVRGGIIDLYAPSFRSDLSGPIRLDFFGDTVESIRIFDPLSQRSQVRLEEAVLLPASDILFPGKGEDSAFRQTVAAHAAEQGLRADRVERIIEQLQSGIRFPGIEFFLPLIYQDPAPQTLFDYLPEETPCLFHDPVAIQQKVDLVWERIQANYQEASTEGMALMPERLFLESKTLKRHLQGRLQINVSSLPDPDAERPPIMLQVGDHSLLKQELDLERKKRGLLAPLVDRLLAWQQAEDSIFFSCRSSRQAGHFEEMLAGYRIQTARAAVPLTLGACPGEVQLVEAPLSRGFDLPDERLHVLSASELFGEQRLRPPAREKNGGAGENRFPWRHWFSGILSFIGITVWLPSGG